MFDCYGLGDGSSEMLYDLALFSKNYLLENKQTEDVKWQHVRKSLTDNDCAIEFVQYNGINDESYLGCLVLKKNSKRPRFIEISPTDSILQRKVRCRKILYHMQYHQNQTRDKEIHQCFGCYVSLPS